MTFVHVKYSYIPEADPCVPDPCLNGGTCSSTLVTFTCECTAQYMGVICDIGKTVVRLLG